MTSVSVQVRCYSFCADYLPIAVSVVLDASLCTHFGIFPPLRPSCAWLIFIRLGLRSHNTSILRPFLLFRNVFSVSLLRLLPVISHV
jgi:hypothetical protein